MPAVRLESKTQSLYTFLMDSLPTGNLTLLFNDIVGLTMPAQEY